MNDRMGRGMRLLVVLGLLCAAGFGGAARAADAAPAARWLMVVKTDSRDAAREAEFNDWYDRIDIPDVLEVPGYRRARRGLGQPLPGRPWADLQPVEGRYVALYDIVSPDIDATVVDMMLAAQRMQARGRDTATLSVVGRFYYREVDARVATARPATPGRAPWLVLLTGECCGDAAAALRFDAWYRDHALPRLREADGVLGITRYRLHRVAMFDPVPMPAFLALIEIDAASAEAAAAALDPARVALADSAAQAGVASPDAATVYRQLADVARSAPDPLAKPSTALVLRGGRVHAPHAVAEAVAIGADGRILAVGSNADIDALRAPGTRVVELAGATVLPGLDDQHVHPVFAGLQARRCVIPQGASLATLRAGVRACAAKAAPGAWITGGQWDAPALGGVPHRRALDDVAAGHPVLLGDTSEHSAWANTKALALAGVTRATPNPPNGIIERDVNGEPTGVLREEAVLLVRRHVPPATDSEVRDALAWSLGEMLAQGITSFTEASAGYSSTLDQEMRAFRDLADAGALKQRTRVCMGWVAGEPRVEALIAARAQYERERLTFDCVKLMLDGVPTDSHTAAMLEPYAGTVPGRDDNASRFGLLAMKQADIDATVTRLDAQGLTVKFHAAGDAAVRAGLNGIEAARKSNGFSGRLHDVGHCTFVSKEDLPRARSLGATFEVSPYLWGPSPINDAISAAVGPDTIQRVWPVREMLDAGALVVAGSDWSVVPSVNPWIAIETLVTREEPGGSARSFGKAEAITLREALDLFTVNAARHRGCEGQLGRIAPGMLADLIVVDQDPYTVPVNRIHRTRVLKTLIGGEVVFERRP